MYSDRSRFISYIFQNATKLRYAHLKNIASSIHEFPPNEVIRILIDKKQVRLFLDIVAKADGIKSLLIVYRPYREILKITFYDNSKIELQLIKGFVHNALACMSAGEVLQQATLNQENIKVPCPQHHFEYIMLSFLLNGKNMEEKYRMHFSDYSIEIRNKIFQHLREKYGFNINTLDDLFDFHKSLLKRIRIRLLAQKSNKKVKRIYRSLLYPFYLITNFFLSKPIQFKFRTSLPSAPGLERTSARHVA